MNFHWKKLKGQTAHKHKRLRNMNSDDTTQMTCHSYSASFLFLHFISCFYMEILHNKIMHVCSCNPFLFHRFTESLLHNHNEFNKSYIKCHNLRKNCYKSWQSFNVSPWNMLCFYGCKYFYPQTRNKTIKQKSLPFNLYYFKSKLNSCWNKMCETREQIMHQIVEQCWKSTDI